MSGSLPIGKPLRIRDCGLDEVWLQDQIVANPASLRLGDLDFVEREKVQSSGGRLDILLKDPEDDSMYEVEVMLGETDESHVIRTIEYWTREKRKWPQREHHAVLVAESITRRFFDVIQVISHAIPIIAIQANIVEANGQRMLTFNKILDSYEEPAEPSDNETHDEAYWIEKAPSTNDLAKAFLAIVSSGLKNPELRYRKRHISIAASDDVLFWIDPRASNKSVIYFWMGAGEQFLAKGKALLDAASISYRTNKRQSICVTTHREFLTANREVFKQLAELVVQAWIS